MSRFRPPHPIASRRASLRAGLALGLLSLGLVGASAAAARDDEATPPEPVREESARDDWRARGLAFFDLPLGIRARFDARYSKYGSPVDHLAAPLATAVGPGLRFERHIESRVAFSRPLTRGIELEIAWQTRNRVEIGDPMGFGRQIVGAMIRIAP